jgi:hypothetical protein
MLAVGDEGKTENSKERARKRVTTIPNRALVLSNVIAGRDFFLRSTAHPSSPYAFEAERVLTRATTTIYRSSVCPSSTRRSDALRGYAKLVVVAPYWQ